MGSIIVWTIQTTAQYYKRMTDMMVDLLDLFRLRRRWIESPDLVLASQGIQLLDPLLSVACIQHLFTDNAYFGPVNLSMTNFSVKFF